MRGLSLAAAAARYLAAGAVFVAGGWGVAAHALEGQVAATGLTQPVYLTAPVGDSRLFIVEKGGTVRLSSGGSLLAAPFLDISAKVATEGERGLLGLAFDPGFADNGRFYVNYIDATTRNTVIERYTVAPGGQVADAASAQRILSFEQEPYANHKAGWMAFRPGDGQHLYIATGDGGSANDPGNNGQDPGSLLGKMLRIDVSGTGQGYAVPEDNPFVGQDGAAPELWALGLRNPWRNSFDRQTGDFWIADVGQGLREELNLERAGDPGGHNYGWRLREGSVATPEVGGDAPGLTDPVFEYPHVGAGALGRSIIGGYVYRGPSIAGADGRYFFGDFVSGRIFSFLPGEDGAALDLRDDTDALLAGTGLSGLASFGEGGMGELYLIGLNGTVVRMVPEPTQWALLAGGLAVVAWQARRRRARNPTGTPATA